MRKIEINGHEFEGIEGVEYRYDYYKVVDYIEGGTWNKYEAIRKLILNDLFFIIYFVMGIKTANNAFTVKMCREVEDGARSKTLDIWARGHYKSTIITIAETVQYHLREPEHCTCIFSYKKPAAEDFLDAVRKTYEYPIMIACFPDVLYQNPYTQSPSWSLQNGITLNRQGKARPDQTVEASGLVEGMLTGRHFNRLIFDDVETADMAESPDEMEKCFSRFEMADNLSTGSDEDIKRVIGTYYSHSGPLVRIRDSKTAAGEPVWELRLIPLTDSGLANGKPVLVSDAKHEELKLKQHYNSQQLCNPTPTHDQKLNPDYLYEIEEKLIPRDVYKFLLVDPAGDSNTNKSKKSDAWSIMLLGIEPGADESGTWKRYILDAFIDKLDESAAVDVISRMYMDGGMVYKFCYEKFSNFTPAVAMHVIEALKKRGRYVSETNKSFVWLRPANRNKHLFITNSLQWPLNNSRWFISKRVPSAYRDRLKMEMKNFPHWHDDGLNTMAYLDDVVKDETFRFRQKMRDSKKPIKYAAVAV